MDNRLHVHAAFLDVAKAFDRVDHSILLSRLADIRMSESTLTWFRSYLSGWEIQTRIDGVMSDPLETTSGVPQGSVLGPLLYLLHVREVPSVSKAGCALFADDTTLHRCGCVADWQLPCCPREGDLQRLSVWAEESKIMFNAAKSASMIIGGKSRGPPLQPICLNGVPVPLRSSQRHLGVILSDNLRWDAHVSRMLQLVSAPLSLLKLLAYRHRLPPMCIRRFYCGFIRPRLEYSSAVWGGCCRKLQSRLERVQLQGARAIVRTPGLSHQELLSRAGLPSLCWRRRIHRLELLWKLVNHQGPPQLQALVPKPASSRCRYSLRATHAIEFPDSGSARMLGSFLGTVVPEWNSLPAEVVSATTCPSFRSRVCKFFHSDRFSFGLL